MVMNKKAQQIIVVIMIGIMIIITTVALSGPLKTQIDETTNATGLNCTNPDNSIHINATCTITDMALFYFIGILIAISIAYVSGKKNITGFITAIFIFVVVTVLITPLKEWVVYLRDASHLNCAAGGLSVGNNLACIVADLWLFYFVVICISTAVTYITVKNFVPEQ